MIGWFLCLYFQFQTTSSHLIASDWIVRKRIRSDPCDSDFIILSIPSPFLYSHWNRRFLTLLTPLPVWTKQPNMNYDYVDEEVLSPCFYKIWILVLKLSDDNNLFSCQFSLYTWHPRFFLSTLIQLVLLLMSKMTCLWWYPEALSLRYQSPPSWGSQRSPNIWVIFSVNTN